jgi:hypothetical protein
MLPMAVAVCGCACAREPDGAWVIVAPEPDCPQGHVAGLRGWSEGEAARVAGIGECITVVFERLSRTAMLCTAADAPRTVAETSLRTPPPPRALPDAVEEGYRMRKA